jgi:uncharacterized RmlC-like cupin family protein
LRGESHVWHGQNLEHHSVVKPGDFFTSPPTCRTCLTIRARPRKWSP